MNEGILEMDREVGRLKDISMVDSDGKGLDDMENSLGEAIEELRLGRSTADQMKILAGQYGSFMDNQHNKNSSVQFIMKTKAIENKEPSPPPAGDGDKPKKAFGKAERFIHQPQGRGSGWLANWLGRILEFYE